MGQHQSDLDSLNGLYLTPSERGGRGFSRHHLEPNEFSKLAVIGRGKFSAVYLVVQKTTKKHYAMKVMEKNMILQDSHVENVLTERNLLSCFSHPFIVSLHYAFQTSRQLFLVLDFVNGGELYYHLSQLRRFSERRVKQYSAEIFLALSFLHRNRIIYRDLKLENVLLDAEGHVMLTDFNFSTALTEDDDRATTFCGTSFVSLFMIAPEVLLAARPVVEGNGECAGYDQAVDFWSLGVLVYELLFGLPPFYAEDVQDCYYKILHHRITFPTNVYVSSSCHHFIRQCLVRDPSKRINRNGIVSHPWFGEYDWESVLQRRIIPEFVPEISGPGDTRYIDPTFLSEPLPPNDSMLLNVPIPRLSLPTRTSENFSGFSFADSPSSFPLSSSPSVEVLSSSLPDRDPSHDVMISTPRTIARVVGEEGCLIVDHEDDDDESSFRSALSVSSVSVSVRDDLVDIRRGNVGREDEGERTRYE